LIEITRSPTASTGDSLEAVSMTDDRKLTLRDAGAECKAVHEDGDLVARLVPHDSGSGWKIVDLNGKALSTQPYETPRLALRYLPRGLPKQRDDADD
jgi:hypothetical protein